MDVNKNERSKELQEGIDFSIKTQGIAYTYRNEEFVEENGKKKIVLGDEILLNPMHIVSHSNPMGIYEENTLIAVGEQPLVFSNMIKAEGALAVVELIYPAYAGKLVIKVYDDKAIIKDIKSPITL